MARTANGDETDALHHTDSAVRPAASARESRKGQTR